MNGRGTKAETYRDGNRADDFLCCSASFFKADEEAEGRAPSLASSIQQNLL